ncbi:large subunit ribosomal protein LP0 [Nematocida sp. AWRm77]|nr:large subunit ribosomal protein LP0 [Nematocida sp. AWRm77]
MPQRHFTTSMMQMEPVIMPKKARKNMVYDRTGEYFGKYKKLLVVDMTNISSRQLQLIRSDLRGKGDFLIGKNTTIKLALRRYIEENPELRGVEDVIKNNVGIIFTNGSLSEITEILDSRKVQAVAKPGDVSQCDLWVEPVMTNMDPGKTSFFQALGIVTKITKGKIEILSRCQTLYKGKKVGHSEAGLLSILGITPFIYKMNVIHAYSDGKFFDIEHLSISEDSIEKMIQSEMYSLSALALGAEYATESTLEQEVAFATREVLALAAGAEIDVSAADASQNE